MLLIITLILLIAGVAGYIFFGKKPTIKEERPSDPVITEEVKEKPKEP